MVNHPNRSRPTLKIMAIYRHRIGEETYACYFDVPRFKTNGVDCNTPEIEGLLISAFKTMLLGQNRALHEAGGFDPDQASVTPGTQILAFYTDRRAKALIERFDRPIVL